MGDTRVIDLLNNSIHNAEVSRIQFYPGIERLNASDIVIISDVDYKQVESYMVTDGRMYMEVGGIIYIIGGGCSSTQADVISTSRDIIFKPNQLSDFNVNGHIRIEQNCRSFNNVFGELYNVNEVFRELSKNSY